MSELTKLDTPSVMPIPVSVFERAQARMERANRRLWILTIILIILLFGTNIGWLVWENQWEYVPSSTITQEVDTTDGGTAYIQDSGNIDYGTR